MQLPRTMITFGRDGQRFTYRVGAIIMHNDRVLFERGADDTRGWWYFLPGGRAELGESSLETIQREMLEELGENAEVERLVFVVENFFVHNDTHHHELGLYFLVHLASSASIYQEQGIFEREEEGRTLIYSWLPLRILDESLVYPVFLKKALLTLPEQTQHIIQTHNTVE